jgi:hypothetical protein
VPVLSRTFFGGRRGRDEHDARRGRAAERPESTTTRRRERGAAPMWCRPARARKIRRRTLARDRDRHARADACAPLPGPALCRIPTSQTKPRLTPLLRANPYPEVTDPICRLPLPTLFYRLEAAHLGDLLRIWVRTGATPPRGPLPDFQGPRDRSRHRRKCGALRVPNPISALGDSRELERSYRTENSASIIRRRLRVLLGYPDELPCDTAAIARRSGRRAGVRHWPAWSVPLPGSVIGNGFPFARCGQVLVSLSVFGDPRGEGEGEIDRRSTAPPPGTPRQRFEAYATAHQYRISPGA